ncbi:carbohydrate-binding protein [Catenulispora rubra]|uniref:carbohydrate-binding protein n=1 Tax=Catenulispora rubra TaxID=280293 RepID=UPI001E313D3C|nr:carbohydrate-binding protein [Catenulispora rubra]
MNGLALTRKQAGIAGAAAIVVGVGLILVPGGGPSSQHVVAADAAARVASSSAAGSASPSGSASSATPGLSATSVPSSSAASSSAAHPAPPPAATTTVTQAAPNSGGGQPPQASSDPASAPRTSAKPSPAPSPHAPAPTTAKPPPPTSNLPAGCPTGSGSSGNAFAPIAGIEHTSCWGLTTESTADDPSRGGNQDLGNLANGAWAEYPKVNFGTGGSQFFGRVASGAVAGISGLVKVHLDNLSSAPVSVFEIANTGGWQSWRTIQMNMNPTTGVHDVYLTFDSGQPQPFVSLHWFDFGN